MEEIGQKASARVNGDLVPRARKGRPGNPLVYNPKIAWFLNESRGALGEKGHGYEPVAGGGDPSDNWPIIERLHRAVGDVERWRTAYGIWCLLTTEQRTTLTYRYKITEREHSQIIGLRATFEDWTALAWHLCEDKPKMRGLLAKSSGKEKREAVAELKRRCNEASRTAHIAWLDAEREKAREWAEK